MTYHGSENDVMRGKNEIAVLGSGPYCIGSSVEFDWSCVQALKTLQKEGFKTIMINSNPETVSTDYDMSDRLYFEELSLERILDIVGFEKPKGVVVSTGGQIPNNLALKLHSERVKILGTSAKRYRSRGGPSHILETARRDRHRTARMERAHDASKRRRKLRQDLAIRCWYDLRTCFREVR